MKKVDIVARLPVIFGLDRLEAAAAIERLELETSKRRVSKLSKSGNENNGK